MEEKIKKDDFDAVREVVEAIKSFNGEDQKRIIRWACEKLNIRIETDYRAPAMEVPKFDTDNMKQPSDIKKRDIKTFIESKNPKSDNHFAATVAYYYQFEAPETERRESINKNDLVNATRLANWDRIKRPDQTLVNCTKAGLLDNIDRGQYRLNSVGENLVAMILPDNTVSIRTKTKKSDRKRNVLKKNGR